MFEWFQPAHMPCPDCGAGVPRAEAAGHECDPERLLDYRLFQLRDDIAGLDGALTDYLGSPEGRFAAWLAERERP
jgi:hypothetical protein